MLIGSKVHLWLGLGNGDRGPTVEIHVYAVVRLFRPLLRFLSLSFG